MAGNTTRILDAVPAGRALERQLEQSMRGGRPRSPESPPIDKDKLKWDIKWRGILNKGKWRPQGRRASSQPRLGRVQEDFREATESPHTPLPNVFDLPPAANMWAESPPPGYTQQLSPISPVGLDDFKLMVCSQAVCPKRNIKTKARAPLLSPISSGSPGFSSRSGSGISSESMPSGFSSFGSPGSSAFRTPSRGSSFAHESMPHQASMAEASLFGGSRGSSLGRESLPHRSSLAEASLFGSSRGGSLASESMPHHASMAEASLFGGSRGSSLGDESMPYRTAVGEASLFGSSRGTSLGQESMPHRLSMAEASLFGGSRGSSFGDESMPYYSANESIRSSTAGEVSHLLRSGGHYSLGDESMPTYQSVPATPSRRADSSSYFADVSSSYYPDTPSYQTPPSAYLQSSGSYRPRRPSPWYDEIGGALAHSTMIGSPDFSMGSGSMSQSMGGATYSVPSASGSGALGTTYSVPSASGSGALGATFNVPPAAVPGSSRIPRAIPNYFTTKHEVRKEAGKTVETTSQKTVQGGKVHKTKSEKSIVSARSGTSLASGTRSETVMRKDRWAHVQPKVDTGLRRPQPQPQPQPGPSTQVVEEYHEEEYEPEFYSFELPSELSFATGWSSPPPSPHVQPGTPRESELHPELQRGPRPRKEFRGRERPPRHPHTPTPPRYVTPRRPPPRYRPVDPTTGLREGSYGPDDAAAWGGVMRPEDYGFNWLQGSTFTGRWPWEDTPPGARSPGPYNYAWGGPDKIPPHLEGFKWAKTNRPDRLPWEEDDDTGPGGCAC